MKGWRTPQVEDAETPERERQDPSEGLGEPGRGCGDPGRRTRRPQEWGAETPKKSWETPRPQEKGLETRGGRRAGRGRTTDRRSQVCGYRENGGGEGTWARRGAMRLCVQVRARVRRARRSASDCSGLAVSPAVDGRARRSASPAAPASHHLSRRSSRARGGSCVPSGSTAAGPMAPQRRGAPKAHEGSGATERRRPSRYRAVREGGSSEAARAERWEWPELRGGASCGRGRRVGVACWAGPEESRPPLATT